VVKLGDRVSSPEVTVVVPTHNRWDHLRRAALPAALGQRDVELELIVVDDGSADQTPRRLAELADPRLRVLRNDVAMGVAQARNRGVAVASAPWVAFLDDDDLWSPWKLRRQLDAVGAVEGAGFAYAAAVFLDGAGAPLRPDPAPPAETVARELRSRDVVGGPSTVLARTELVRELGGFDHALSVLADWDLWLRLAELAPAAACPEVLVAYREHGDNMSAETAQGVFAELDLLRRRHALGSELDGVEFTRWVAGHQRRAGRPLAASRAYLHGARQFRSGALLVRGLGMPLGERAMGIPARLRALRGKQAEVVSPDWVDAYPGLVGADCA
jgi:glycosyltransferase involved in cell wall biosynthesis